MLDTVARPPRVPVLRTDEETIELLRRIAPHYSNATNGRALPARVAGLRIGQQMA